MGVYARLLDHVGRDGTAALVTLSRTDGSTPRDQDAYMIVTRAGDFSGTIGGGALEYSVLQKARSALTQGRSTEFSHVLGPDLGQCCGGAVRGMIQVFSKADIGHLADLQGAETDPDKAVIVERGPGGEIARRIVDRQALPSGSVAEDFAPSLTPVFLFGAGHVGRALVLALAPLPFSVTWIDERSDAFPSAFPPGVTPVASADAPAELAKAPAGAFIVVMTHSHELDLRIVHAALAEQRFGFVGLIGSMTKRARFLSRLAALGIEDAGARLTCPIGLPQAASKLPSVIAATTASQLLALRFGIAER